MASSGAESRAHRLLLAERAALGRRAARPLPLDGVVLQAARRGLPVLPIVTGTPGWAASRRRATRPRPPRDPALYADFLRTLVARYGPQGSLWAEHPEVAARPIRDWQIWNEPNLTRYWTPPRGQGFARGYVKLLRAARPALRAGRPAARAPSSPGCRTSRWIALRRIYKAGGRALLRRGGAAPVHGQAAQRRPPRRVRPARDAPLRRRPQADLGHRAVLAGGEGQDEEHDRLRDDRPRPGVAGSATACGCSRAPASGCGSSGSSGTRGSRARTRRTRSTTPACGASATGA